jgi:hypothetical protein
MRCVFITSLACMALLWTHSNSAAQSETKKTLERIQELGGQASLDKAGVSIIRIHLGGTKATDADLALLAGVAELVELSLAKTNISDAGLPNVARLRKLETLHLADNPITDN